MTEVHHRGHEQALEEPVPEELGRDVALVEAHDEEVRDHEGDRGHHQVGQL